MRVETFQFLQLMEVAAQGHLRRVAGAVHAIVGGEGVIEVQIGISDCTLIAGDFTLRVIDLVEP